MLIVKGYRRKRRLVKCFLNRSSAFDLRGFRSQAIIDGRTRKSAGTGLLCATQHTNLVPLQAIASPKGVAIPFPGDCFVALLLAMTSYLFRLCLINETGKISKYMKILVCIKQVPDCFETLRIDERTGLLSFPPDSAFRMNRFDEFALEEALLIKERFSPFTAFPSALSGFAPPCSGPWGWARTIAFTSLIQTRDTSALSRSHSLLPPLFAPGDTI
jgi:hypothetical protein